MGTRFAFLALVLAALLVGNGNAEAGGKL